jgi:hypothetical protein
VRHSTAICIHNQVITFPAAVNLTMIIINYTNVKHTWEIAKKFKINFRVPFSKSYKSLFTLYVQRPFSYCKSDMVQCLVNLSPIGSHQFSLLYLRVSKKTCICEILFSIYLGPRASDLDNSCV